MSFVATVLLLSTCVAATNSEPLVYSINNAEELQKAINLMGPKGGTINLAPGVYEISDTLSLSKVNQMSLVGSGWNTTIKKRGAGDALELKDCGFCFIRNLMISGEPDSATGSGIAFRGRSSSCVVDYCRISTFPESGIRYEGNPKSPMSSNTVSNCHFISNKGVQLYSYANNDFYIIGNQFGTHSGNPEVGCVLDHSSAGTYSMNYHWGNVHAFILGPSAHYNRIENNRFEESLRTGVLIGKKDGPPCIFNIITGNTIHTNSKEKFGGYPAVEAFNSCDITFCNNQTLSWSCDTTRHKSSLVLGTGCARWIVRNNFFRYDKETPLIYDENAGHLVGDNIVQQ